jgi:penicillin amidase
VPFGRFLKYINLSIAVLLVAGLIAAYWTAYRPLAQTSGQITAPVSAHATLSRDAIGVPHITAANWEDAIFLQGFVTAQDRLWQMDGLRRLAAGELSEIVGSSALELDRDARRLRMRRMAEEDYRTLPPADRAVLAAYARGVNYFIETHRTRLPLEFTILRYDPRPWSVTDSILCGLQMYRNLTTTWKEELQKQAMLEGGDAAKVNFLFTSRIGMEFQPGSNAWAISGRHTASGKPILANDPHLEFGIPSTWYQVHLKAPGLDVIGVSLPGVPCVIIGHNQRIAWGVTNLGFDVQDLYIEKFDPRTGRYVFRGQLEQARAESERIPVKGSRPVDFQQWVTRHGPVSLMEGNRFLALRWSAAEPGSFQFPFLELNRAGNWREFTAAVARFSGPGQNFVYADVDGNIGYHASGLLPIRKNYDGDVPVDGSSGEYEWEGFIPFDQLPSFYNPPQGWIVTANQNPFPENYPYRVHGNFASPYRSLEIRSLLTSHQAWKPDQMLAVQKDVYSAFSHFLAQQVVAACDRKKPANANLTDAIALLRSWNGQMEKQTPAPMLISLVYLEVRKRIAESAAPGKSDFYGVQMAPAVIEKILRNDARGWFEDRDGLLIRALTDAVEAGRQSQGSNVKRWNYGQFNRLTIKHPVGDKLPLLAAYFNVGPVEMSGSSTSIKQTTLVLGPSMRFVADFSDWDHSLNNLTIGESGQFLSSHYKDQWDAYYTGRSFPMQFQRVDAKSTLDIQPK